MNVLLGQIMNNKIQKDKKKPTSTSKVVVVQSLSHVQLFETPRTAARQASLSITNSQSLLKLMYIELVMPSNHFIHLKTHAIFSKIF